MGLSEAAPRWVHINQPCHGGLRVIVSKDFCICNHGAISGQRGDVLDYGQFGKVPRVRPNAVNLATKWKEDCRCIEL